MDNKKFAAGVSVLIPAIGIYTGIATYEINNGPLIFVLLCIAMFCTLVGGWSIWNSLFGKDEKLDFEKKKYQETVEEKRKLERLEEEKPKIEQIYKPLKTYLSTKYLGEVKDVFSSKMLPQPDISIIKLLEYTSEGENNNILLHNKEDEQIITDVKEMFWSHTAKMQEHYNTSISKKNRQESEMEIAKGLVELLPDVNQLLGKIERKINDPLSIYGETNG